METDKDTAIEHQNVPIEHRSLHDFLYSSEDEHGGGDRLAAIEVANDGAIAPLPTWCDRATNAKIAGVYAVLDSQQQTQYVGYSRNVLLSLNGHLAQNGEKTCAFVRVQAFKFPKRTEMEELQDAWIAELETLPSGNGDESDRWASSIGEVAKAAMSEAERQEYEEKKLKLRKAMADGTLTQLESQPIDIRQENLRAAVQNDDWSAVIQTQTQETQIQETQTQGTA
jgi:predicted GIY-YIG superfamily endonuclease